MPTEKLNPAAGRTADGALVFDKAGANEDTPEAPRLQVVHLSRRFCLTPAAAALIAPIAFPEVAP